MKLVCLPFLFGAMLGLAAICAGQATTAQPQPTPLPKIADTLKKRLDGTAPGTGVSRETRERAYAKLMEGQRHIWSAKRLRSRAGIAHAATSARQALLKAVEIDPRMAEAYTALAELAINTQPVDVDEGIALAAIALGLDPNNFGAHRILARLYTYKSRISGETFDPAFGEKAIAEWKEVARLDPRNAEAWAFLGELYSKTGKTDESITALRNWLSAVPPVQTETQFYTFLMGRQESPSPENASLKLGPALLKAGRVREAVQVLSNVVADDPDNAKAVELLREALESADGDNASIAVESLQQAVYANPANLSLIGLLSQVYRRSGRLNDAVALLRESSARLVATDRAAAGAILISLGDIFISANRAAEAMAAYEDALKVRGLDNAETLDEDEREIVMLVFEKMIQALKSSDRSSDVRAVIERARKLLGRDELFADRELISYYRETGKRQEALDAIRAVRVRKPDDYGFMRLEATLLTELGRVDEAVEIVRKSMAKPATPANPPASGDSSVMIAVPPSDQFSDYLFISSLYSQANRGKEAAEAANQAYSVARGKERKQIAKLTLATAQQQSGDFGGAETTLREILKESPNNPIAMNNLGYFLLERDTRLEEAFKLIQEAVKVDPTNPSFLDSLGWAHFKLGRLEEAEKHLKEASRYNSGSATIQEHLGDVYLKQGKPDLAKNAWGKALVLASEEGDIKRLKDKLASGSK